MTQYDNTNRGAIWRNEKKRPDKRDPDFTGTINVDGAEYYLSGWLPDPERKGPKTPAMTYSVRRMDDENPRPIERTIEANPAPDVNDQIPW
jgi:hypothetical protein